MRIPIDWLNEYVPNTLPVKQLADTLTGMGLEVEEIESTAGSAVFNITVLSVRGDCLSVEGTARELATALHGEFARRQPSVTETGPPAEDMARVVLDDPALCPRYSARIVRKVKIGPSPEWAHRRLLQCGMRPINNIVDATNLVMLELGQPLHAFDYRLLRAAPCDGVPSIIVRRAKAGEKLVTIDAVERALDPEVLLITDPGGPIALAGIMGGSSSEINERTTEVLLESAHFNPRTVRRGARWLGMSTEASYRFERGVDPSGTVRALDRVCELIAEFSGGTAEIARGVIDAYPHPIEEEEVTLRPARANALLGVELSAEEMAEHLRRLQLEVLEVGPPLRVRVPTFRMDLKDEIDLVEEVARAYGYRNIPEALPPNAAAGKLAPELALEGRLRQLAQGQGLSETVTSSLEGPEQWARLGLPEGHPLAAPIRLNNPKSEDRSQLRTTLLTSLLEVVAVNRRYGVEDVGIFDLGKVYLPRGENELPYQPAHLGLAGTGVRWQGLWPMPKEALRWDFYALKQTLAQLLRSVARVDADFLPDEHACFAAPQCARVVVAGETVGHLGQVRDSVLEAWDLPDPVYAAEVDLDAVRAHAGDLPQYRPVSRFPASVRDVAFVLPREVAAQRAEGVIRDAAGPALEDLRLFDVYEGRPLPEGHRNLAFSLAFRRLDRTLTDEEVEATMERVRGALRRELGAAIRE
jgi:phenylalanyl-tRNA synthetase beta chain